MKSTRDHTKQKKENGRKPLVGKMLQNYRIQGIERKNIEDGAGERGRAKIR